MAKMNPLTCDEDELERVFCMEVQEIRDDLVYLNDKILEASKTLSALAGERARLQSRIEFLSNRHYAKKKDTCSHCLIS